MWIILLSVRMNIETQDLQTVKFYSMFTTHIFKSHAEIKGDDVQSLEKTPPSHVCVLK